jgi:hypothetical protein
MSHVGNDGLVKKEGGLMRRIFVAFIAPVLLLAVGCAKPPTEKVGGAEKAVEDARAAGAPQYMGEDFAKLESMLNAAKAEIATQDGKMPFLRDYGKAEQGLAAVQADAGRVIDNTGKRKEEAKAAAVQAQQAAEAAVQTAKDLTAQAPVGKDRAALEAIKADAEGLSNSMAEVQVAIDKGDYQAAQAKAKAIQDKGQALAVEIQAAMEKINTAKAVVKGKSVKTKK